MMRLESRTVFTAGEGEGGGIESEIGFLLGGAVAGVAVFCQNRFDLGEVINGAGRSEPQEKGEGNGQGEGEPFAIGWLRHHLNRGGPLPEGFRTAYEA